MNSTSAVEFNMQLFISIKECFISIKECFNSCQWLLSKHSECFWVSII